MDAGCGTGASTQFLINLGIKPENILGVDISPSMLEVAKKALPKVTFQEENLIELKLQEANLNIVISCMALHFLDQKGLEAVVNNFSNGLVDGGRLIFIVVHPLRYPSNYKRYFSEDSMFEATPWGTEIEYYPKKVSDYVNATINAGFEILAVEEPNPNGEKAKKDIENYGKYALIPSRLAIVAKKK